MRVDELATVHVTARLRGAGLLGAPRAMPILMYHSVSVDPEVGVSSYYRVTTSPRRFREQMARIAAEGWTTVTISEAIQRLGTRAPGWDRCLAITFDDGFHDFLCHAKPILDDFGFSATMFLATGYIGHERRRFKNRDCLTWSEVKALSGARVEFGTHTVTHPQLYRMDWRDIRRELRDSRRDLESQLGRPALSFAYPYAFPQEDAAFTVRLRSELGDAGYAGAVTTAIGRVCPTHDPLALRRLPVNEADGTTMFDAKLAGAYDWVGGLQFLSRRLQSRLKSDQRRAS